MQTMAAWFGLQGEHRDFSIRNAADARLFFARHELDQTLHSLLRRSFRTNNPPKLLLYGDWGVGKTHTMRHIEFVIENTADFKALVVFVEMPDIQSSSSFQVAHAALLDALGFDRAKDWVLKYQTAFGKDTSERIKEFTQSGDIATAFANLLAMGEGSRIAWDWLRGMPLSAADSRLVALPQRVDQSNQFVHVLQMFGRLCAHVEQKLLVFMLDEATKLQYVTKQDAINHWTNAFKLIADPLTKEIGFIVSGSWVDPDDMALPLQDPQVLSRFGDANILRLANLNEDETKEFAGALVEALVDADKRKVLTEQHVGETAGESVGPKSFPFTEKGLDVVAAWICKDGGYTTPRDIQKKLDDLLNRAIDDGIHILSSKYVTSQVSR